MSKKSYSVFLIFKVAFAYVGSVVGAGFASGQEVLRFFTMYGQNSIWAIIISALLFICVGSQVLLIGHELKATSINNINKKIFGHIYPIVTGYLIVAIFIICTAMLAGSGALFQEYLGVNRQIGVLMTGFLAIIVILFGVKGILTVNSIIVPVLLIFNIFILAFTFFEFNVPDDEIGFITSEYQDIVKSGISYAAFNIVLSSGVLAPMGRKINNLKILITGGVLGGAILGLMLMGSNYCLWTHIPYIYDYEIPMLFIIKDMSSFISKFYALVLWGSIFTTLVCNLFTIISIAGKKVNSSLLLQFAFSFLIIGCGYLFSYFGFSNIVSIFYPTLGLIGIVFMIMIMFVNLRRRYIHKKQ